MGKTWPVRISVLGLALFGVLFLIFVSAGHREARDGLNSSVTIRLPAPRPYVGKTKVALGFSQPIL